MATYTVLGATVPALTDLNDSDSYALGMVVQITAPCLVTHARRYGSTTPPSGPVTWRLSDLASGDLITSHVFASSAAGWIEEELAEPILIESAQNVIVWIGTPDRYVATSGFFTSGAGASGITNGPLTAPNSAGDPQAIGQGRFGGDPDSIPAGTISGGNYFVDLVVADVPVPEGSAAFGLELAVATTGDAPAIDPSEGAAAFAVEYALAGVGETPAVGPNEGAAVLGLVYTVASSGEAPEPGGASGSADFPVAFSFSGEGLTPNPGEASGVAAFGLVYTVASAGLNPAPGGSAAFSLALALAAEGDNDEPFQCRTVRSWSEVMSS